MKLFGVNKFHDRSDYRFDPKGIGYSYRGYSLFWGNKIAIGVDSGVPDFNYYGIARQLGPYAAAGFSLKFKRRHPSDVYQFFGYETAYDLGLLFKPHPNLKFGCLAQNLEGYGSNGSRSASPIVMRSTGCEARRVNFQSISPFPLKMTHQNYTSVWSGTPSRYFLSVSASQMAHSQVEWVLHGKGFTSITPVFSRSTPHPILLKWLSVFNSTLRSGQVGLDSIFRRQQPATTAQATRTRKPSTNQSPD